MTEIVKKLIPPQFLFYFYSKNETLMRAVQDNLSFFAWTLRARSALCECLIQLLHVSDCHEAMPAVSSLFFLDEIVNFFFLSHSYPSILLCRWDWLAWVLTGLAAGNKQSLPVVKLKWILHARSKPPRHYGW